MRNRYYPDILVGWRSPRGLHPQHLLMLLALCGLVSLVVVGCGLGGASGDSGSGVGGDTATVRLTNTPPAFQSPGPLGKAEAGQGVPAIKPTQSGVPSFGADDMKSYLQSHPPVGLVRSSGTASITRAEFVASGILAGLLHTFIDRPDTALMGYVEEQGDFTFAGPTPTQSLHFSFAYEAFDATTGNLVLNGGLNAAIPDVPTATPPTPIPHPPTLTPTQVPPAPKLSVTPSKTTAFCANGGWPNKLMVKNVGTDSLTWKLTSTLPTGVTMSPTSGTLSEGASQDVALQGTIPQPVPQQFTLTFSSDGGTQDVVIACQ